MHWGRRQQRRWWVSVAMMVPLLGWSMAPPNQYRDPYDTPHPHRQTVTSFGWHEGGYFGVGVTMLHNHGDKNVLTGETFGDPIDPGIQLTFGWWITDRIAAEVDVRVATPHATFDGTQETELAGRADLVGRYAFLPRWGAVARQCHLIPYLKGGALLYLLTVKGNTRDESKIAAVGSGLLAGGGLEAVFGRRPQFFLDLSLDGAMVVLDGQQVGGVTVTASGVQPQLGGALMMGIHF